MTDKELIKKEIERRITISLEQGYTYSAAQLKRIIDFIDSLPEEPASEDLEEATSKYVREDFHERSRADFKAGAEWQKQQMMKDALDATIVNDWQYGKDPDHAIIPAIHQRIDGFDVGDRVKIIIVKED